VKNLTVHTRQHWDAQGRAPIACLAQGVTPLTDAFGATAEATARRASRPSRRRPKG